MPKGVGTQTPRSAAFSMEESCICRCIARLERYLTVTPLIMILIAASISFLHHSQSGLGNSKIIKGFHGSGLVILFIRAVLALIGIHHDRLR